MHLKSSKSLAAALAATVFLCLGASPLAISQASVYSADDFAGSEPRTGVPQGMITYDQNTPYLFWVSLESGRLHVLERLDDDQYKEIENIPISIGKKGYGKEIEGDQKTPVGVYQITSFLKDEDLDDFYGLGAYPINYPNSWDKLSSRTGYGIWLHGLPKGVDSRPMLDSNGCVVIDNSKLDEYSKYITTGTTTMVLADEPLRLLPETSEHEFASVMDAMERWESNWEANNADAYLNNYHTDFTDFRRNLDQWKTYKRRVNGAKSFIDVELSDLSVFAYPGEEDIVVSRFYQNYSSSNYKWAGWKQLIWKLNDQGQWKILFEGNG